MKAISESAEHHFMTMLEQIKSDEGNWVSFYFACSRTVQHAKLMANSERLGHVIAEARKEVEALFRELNSLLSDVQEGVVYLFPDHDILVLARPSSEEDRKLLVRAHQKIAAQLPHGTADKSMLGKSFYNYQQLADAKILGAKRMEVYEILGDQNRIGSLAMRRARRDVPFVLVVEDDRFTAAYTSSILNKEYDLTVSRNGAEAIADYIEHAPDIVFLDIHLPCLDGQEVLQIIQMIDPESYVVMLSVDASKQNIVKASVTGAQTFLKKPFSKDRVLAAAAASPFIQDKRRRMEA